MSDTALATTSSTYLNIKNMPYLDSDSEGEGRESQPPLAQCIGESIPHLNQSLWSMFAETAAQYPSNDAVVSCWQQLPPSNTSFEVQTPGIERWSYRDLLQRSESLAAYLKSRGCKEGMRLVVLMWNSTEWAIFFWAAAKLRMTFVPLDPRTTTSIAVECFKSTQPYALAVQDHKIAMALGIISQGIPINICCSQEQVKGWEIFSDTSSFSFQSSLPDDQWEIVDPGRDVALIVYTSGTTSTPKGCPHTASSLWAQTFDFDPNEDGNLSSDRWLVHTPTSHVIGINNALRAWRYGGACIFPSKSFDIISSLKALQTEKCTRMGAVPTLIQAMVDHPAFPSKEALHLQYISLGGTIITAEHVKKCQAFGCPTAMPAFGMSEGVPITSWRRTDPLYHSSHYPGVGKVLPGAMIRICSPSEPKRTILNLGAYGELHVGGASVIEHYLDNRDPDSFYRDEYGTWLITGDLACIDESGVMHITGRIKDLIIRGGENLAPARIECCLEGLPGVAAHVVGVPDVIAGEIPVAVVRSLQQYSKAKLHDQIRGLGTMYALGAIFSLEDLGIESFPLTTSGKVRKDELKQRVITHMRLDVEAALQTKQPQSTAPDLMPPKLLEDKQSPVSMLIEQLQNIWYDLGNPKPAADEPLSEFSDSITMLRYCDKVWRLLGKKIQLQDLIVHASIAQQAEFLTQQKHQFSPVKLGTGTPRTGLPALEDVAFANNDSRRMNDISSAATNILKSLGLVTMEAEDVLPIRDAYHALANGPRPQSYRHRTLYNIKNQSVETVKVALRKCLDAHSIFRTLLARMPDGTPFHLVVRPGDIFYSHLISTHTVANSTGMQGIFQDDSAQSFRQDQMFEAKIITIEQSKSIYLMLTYNHSVFDAVSMIRWNGDLDRLIVDNNAEILAPTPFGHFADVIHSYGSSQAAISDVEYFVRRLRGISHFENAIWPPKRAPGWMCGNDEGSEHHSRRNELRKENNDNLLASSRVMKSAQVPYMQSMKSKYQLQPSLIVKTAVALFNIEQTGQQHAIFNSLDSGRDWPFMLPWMKQALPPAMTIDGPTLELTMNMLRILPSESVGKLLKRLEEDQRELTRHAHAPWFKVLEKLDEEGEIVRDASLRQCFNWDVSLTYLQEHKNDLEALQLAGRADWPDCGIFWSASMLDGSTVCLAAVFDDLQLSLLEVNLHVQRILEIVSVLADPLNWDLDVGSVLRRG